MWPVVGVIAFPTDRAVQLPDAARVMDALIDLRVAVIEFTCKGLEVALHETMIIWCQINSV